MKKTVSILLCLLLILLSVNICFASPTTWDTSDQANLLGIFRAVTSYGSSNLYYYVKDISSKLATSNTILDEIADALFSNGHSVAYYIDNISTWMSPIYNSITSNPTTLNNIFNKVTDIYNQVYAIRLLSGNLNTYLPTINQSELDIIGLLAAINTDASGTTRTPYLFSNGKSVSEWLNSIDDRFGLKSYPYYFQNNPNTQIPYIRYDSNGQLTTGYFTASSTPWSGLYYFLNSIGTSVGNIGLNLLGNPTITQNVVNWGSLSTSTFTPTNGIDGIYKYLNSIQAPIARLSYVHASDEEIAAREKAALNQDAVVDNFIDSNGSGTAPASSFSDVANMSASYISNMDTDASASGIWNIFNSNNFGWFSQETVNQLDTTVSIRKGSPDFDTPLLDHQIVEIYKELGVDVND